MKRGEFIRLLIGLPFTPLESLKAESVVPIELDGPLTEYKFPGNLPTELYYKPSFGSGSPCISEIFTYDIESPV